MADVQKINGYMVADAANRANVAPDYDATQTYAVNDYVLHDGQLYKCTTEVDTAEDFDSTKWTACVVTEEMITAVNVDYNASTKEITIS